MLTAATAGFALQSWLVAKLVQVFQFSGQKLASAANFWSLMFFILALAMAVCYYALGMASNSISMVCFPGIVVGASNTKWT